MSGGFGPRGPEVGGRGTVENLVSIAVVADTVADDDDDAAAVALVTCTGGGGRCRRWSRR